MSRSRLEFSKSTKREGFRRSSGICECHRVRELMLILDGKPCTVRLTTGNIEYHHIAGEFFRPDNSLENLACLTRTCHALVTNLHQRKEIARAKRREDRHRGIRSTPRQSLLGTFRSGVRKGIGDVPRWRDTGRQWPRSSPPRETR